jgi:hypothetical protein
VIPRACWPGNFVSNFVSNFDSAKLPGSIEFGIKFGTKFRTPLVQARFRCVYPASLRQPACHPTVNRGCSAPADWRC